MNTDFTNKINEENFSKYALGAVSRSKDSGILGNKQLSGFASLTNKNG